MDTTQTLKKNMDDYDIHSTKLSRTQGWESSYFFPSFFKKLAFLQKSEYLTLKA